MIDARLIRLGFPFDAGFFVDNGDGGGRHNPSGVRP